MRLTPAALVAVVLLAGCSGGSSKPTPDPTPSITDVKVFTGLGTKHFGKGSDYPHTYPQTPPVGGDHSKAWLRCDVYTAAVPNENAVHSLEHGAVWLTYRPGLDAASVAALAALSQLNINYVLVSPYPGLPAPVVASAWGLQLTVESASDPRLAEFVRTYAGGGQGGEPGADCRKRGFTPEQAADFDKRSQQ